MTDREFTLLFLGVAIVGVAIALHRQGALRTPGLIMVSGATAAVLAFLIFAYT
ncbi:hypothetical protein [Azospirillum sp. TSO22-1]|uniref:hypothetical protein n=1 Tax=Azospirillum sp. TSO22-1 TaxID=716789 RepID=UPI001304EB02|nr:hypothetical protein [Azospirillum sp. TSO22-1]